MGPECRFTHGPCRLGAMLLPVSRFLGLPEPMVGHDQPTLHIAPAPACLYRKHCTRYQFQSVAFIEHTIQDASFKVLPLL